MSMLREVISVLCLFVCVEAQQPSNQGDVNPLHPSMAVVLVVLSIMFCITFLIVAYAKFCQRLQPYHANEVQEPGGNGIVRSRSRLSGIDRTVIDSLPFFRFSSLRGSKEGLECAVCLSRFEDAEILRLLPRCRHAFHMNCIDKWLENHSSCPLCRYKFDVGDLKSLTYTNSFRNPRTSVEEPNLEFFIQRETNQAWSSRFNMANSFQKLGRGKREEPLIQEFRNENSDRKLLHNLKHRIIVSDVIHKSRWSDVNSSDLMSLNSEMLNVISSKRFSSLEANSGRFTNELSAKEQILKIKEDMERKRLYESKVNKIQHSSAATCSCPDDSDIELDRSTTSNIFDPAEKRSMSEITNISRFTEFSARSRLSTADKDDYVRRLWLPIARRTIQWFVGRETSNEARKQAVIV
ncbi:E3 ubiquitin-protein ligase ATL42 [Sesamum alatum]|uniref:RING-type E3 ubiquitin transferase n=1 Tax=Sesamum alatum TaxID=300844 RepID=A0AAE2CF73_9LAMI|nr:E3 ubiquitin-protein ligase ATL42 [Sesamum alatum]